MSGSILDVVRVCHSITVGGDGLRGTVHISVFEPGFTMYKKPRHEVILFVYGGSKPPFERSRLVELQLMFTQRGFVTASFDFRGQIPNSGVDYERTGLFTRVEDLECVADYLREQYPGFELSIYAQSMGGHLAAYTCQEIVPTRMMLVAPAAYHPDCMRENVTFGTPLKRVLDARSEWWKSFHPDSGESNSVFEILSDYFGHVLIIAFPGDMIVPRAITDRYYQSTPARREMFFLRRCVHGRTFGMRTVHHRQRCRIATTCLRWLDGKSQQPSMS
jgi:hypothetical protein